jgi:hypothetical protein
MRPLVEAVQHPAIRAYTYPSEAGIAGPEVLPACCALSVHPSEQLIDTARVGEDQHLSSGVCTRDDPHRSDDPSAECGIGLPARPSKFVVDLAEITRPEFRVCPLNLSERRSFHGAAVNFPQRTHCAELVAGRGRCRKCPSERA